MEFIYSDAFSPWPNKNPSKYIKQEVRGTAVMRTGFAPAGREELKPNGCGEHRGSCSLACAMLDHVQRCRSAFLGIILLTFSYSFCLGLIHCLHKCCRDVDLENISPELSTCGIAQGKLLRWLCREGVFSLLQTFKRVI